MTTEEAPNVALAVAEVRRLVEVGFEKNNGLTQLILQRLDQVDNRHAELAIRVDELETAFADAQREMVTRTQLADRTRLIIAIVGVLVTIASSVIALIALTRG